MRDRRESIIFLWEATRKAQDEITWWKKGKWRRLEVCGLIVPPFHMEMFWSEPIGSEISAALLLKREVGEGREPMATFPPKPHDPFPMWHIPEPWKGEGGAPPRVGLGVGRWFNSQPSTASSCLLPGSRLWAEGRQRTWMCSEGFLVVYGIFQSPVWELLLTKKTYRDCLWNQVPMKVCARDRSITAGMWLGRHNTFSFSYFFRAIWRFYGLKCSLGALDLLQVQKDAYLGSSVK